MFYNSIECTWKEQECIAVKNLIASFNTFIFMHHIFSSSVALQRIFFCRADVTGDLFFMKLSKSVLLFGKIRGLCVCWDSSISDILSSHESHSIFNWKISCIPERLTRITFRMMLVFALFSPLSVSDNRILLFKVIVISKHSRLFIFCWSHGFCDIFWKDVQLNISH